MGFLNSPTRERLFGYDGAFDHPVTRAIVIVLACVLVVTPIALWLLARLGKIDAERCKELRTRYRTWLVLIPLLVAPVLLGAAWTILGVALLSLLLYREYARATGLFRERLVSLLVVVGILAVTFAAADHWYGFFVALCPLTVGAIAALSILHDRPTGYIQRVALGTLGFMLFGCALGHLGYMANDPGYRPVILVILFTVEANDIFAYIAGKTLGKRRLAPNTSPNKTVGGAVGALLLTTALAYVLLHLVYGDTALDRPQHLIALGMLISVCGQFGDLVVSSVKRDLGIKDLGKTLPGHGGLLDRFDSLILVSPAVFHYGRYFVGIGLDEPTRIFSG